MESNSRSTIPEQVTSLLWASVAPLVVWPQHSHPPGLPGRDVAAAATQGSDLSRLLGLGKLCCARLALPHPGLPEEKW